MHACLQIVLHLKDFHWPQFDSNIKTESLVNHMNSIHVFLLMWISIIPHAFPRSFCISGIKDVTKETDLSQ